MNFSYLWRPIFEKYDNLSRSCTTSSRSPEVNTPADKSSLKENCMKRCVTSRNRRVLHKMKKKKNLYTGLHDSKDVHLALQVCGGVSWQLSLVDHSDSEHCMVYQDATYHLTTLSLRWFELETLALDQVKEIRIYSINPLFYDVGAQKFIENGPYQRSLIKSFVINWKKWKSQHRAKAGDDLILLYDLSCGIYVATFKEEESLAFICASFAYEHFIEKCLYGNSKSIYYPPESESLYDDFISNFGLLNYDFTFQLHTMKQGVWDQQFRSLDCKTDFIDKFARFNCLKAGEQLFVVKKEFEFPWKTSLFKGRLQNTICLDAVVLDDTKSVFHTTSSIVTVKKKEIVKGHDFNMDYSGGTVHCIDFTDDTIQIHLELSKMEEGDYFLTCCTLLISLDAINERFGTKYNSLTKERL